MPAKIPMPISVLEAARDRVAKSFDMFERLYISFSGGKDSSVMFHLVAAEAKKRGRKVGVLIIDLEAQYTATIKHIEEMVSMYADCIGFAENCFCAMPCQTTSQGGFAGRKRSEIYGFGKSRY
jgi:predicted phosphoadenosine phosphosulfate sulfurtransferase